MLRKKLENTSFALLNLREIKVFFDLENKTLQKLIDLR